MFVTTLHTMPAIFSKMYSQNVNDFMDPSKMFGLINCDHKGYVGFEFDDYPEEDELIPNEKLPNEIEWNECGSDALSEAIHEREGMIRIWLFLASHNI